MIEDELSKLFPDVAAERPLECSECKKRVQVLYTEVTKEAMIHTAMCADCPELQCRLHGTAVKESAVAAGSLTLCCGTCQTTLSAVKTGHLLGCSDCYEVFDEFIRQELLLQGRLPDRFTAMASNLPMHIGKAAGLAMQVNPSLKLSALNEALNETLKKEDYEQAASLRDQIKKLTEGQL